MSETGVGMASPDHEHFMKLREANEAFYGFVEVIFR